MEMSYAVGVETTRARRAELDLLGKLGQCAAVAGPVQWNVAAETLADWVSAALNALHVGTT